MSSPNASGQSPPIAPPANTAPPSASNAVAALESVSVPPPPPSRVVVAWLVVFLINIIMVAFLLPEWIYESKQVTTLTKILPALLGVLFAAGLLWLRGIALTLPKRRSFQVVNGVALILLLPMLVSQQNVIPVYPEVSAEGTKVTLLVDDIERAYEPGGRVWLSFSNHTIKIVPDKEKTVSKEGEAEPESEVAEGQFKVTLWHVIYRLFGYYWPKWGPLYRVGVVTPEANVDIMIHMTNGQFDSFYLAHPPLTKLNKTHNTTFKVKPGSVNEFVYHGADAEYGCIDRLYLPRGHYSFTASREGCQNKPNRQFKIGADPGPYTVSFADPLCGVSP